MSVVKTYMLRKYQSDMVRVKDLVMAGKVSEFLTDGILAKAFMTSLASPGDFALRKNFFMAFFHSYVNVEPVNDFHLKLLYLLLFINKGAFQVNDGVYCGVFIDNDGRKAMGYSHHRSALGYKFFLEETLSCGRIPNYKFGYCFLNLLNDCDHKLALMSLPEQVPLSTMSMFLSTYSFRRDRLIRLNVSDDGELFHISRGKEDFGILLSVSDLLYYASMVPFSEWCSVLRMFRDGYVLNEFNNSSLSFRRLFYEFKVIDSGVNLNTEYKAIIFNSSVVMQYYTGYRCVVMNDMDYELLSTILPDVLRYSDLTDDTFVYQLLIFVTKPGEMNPTHMLRLLSMSVKEILYITPKADLMFWLINFASRRSYVCDV